MKQITTLAAAILLAMSLAAAPAFAGDHQMNPCNPCTMNGDMAHNPCNPCAMKKHMKDHNPCSMTDKMEHTMNPCNPCSMNKHHED